MIFSAFSYFTWSRNMQDLTVRKNTLFNVVSTCVSAAALGLMPLGHAYADSGPYIGGSVGSVTIQAEIPVEKLGEVFEFDENDFAWKAFGSQNLNSGRYGIHAWTGRQSISGSSSIRQLMRLFRN
jgi:hypothetical protein